MLFISVQLLKTIILQYNNNKTHIAGTITVVTYMWKPISNISNHGKHSLLIVTTYYI